MLTDHHTTEWLLASMKIYKVIARFAHRSSHYWMASCLNENIQSDCKICSQIITLLNGFLPQRKYTKWLQDMLTEHHTTEWLLASTKNIQSDCKICSQNITVLNGFLPQRKYTKWLQDMLNVQLTVLSQMASFDDKCLRPNFGLSLNLTPNLSSCWWFGIRLDLSH